MKDFKLKPGEILIISGPEFVSHFPVRSDLAILDPGVRLYLHESRPGYNKPLNSCDHPDCIISSVHES